jgi:hypothetical protein
VSSQNLIRMSGLAATLAGTCFIVAELLTPTTLLMNQNALRWIAVTDRFIMQSSLTLIAAILLLGGLVGLYVGQLREAGRLGLVGFFAAFFGTALIVGDFYANTFVTPLVAYGHPDVLDGPFAGVLGLWLPVEFGFLTLTWLLFAVATLRARVYPRGATWLLLVGAIVALVPLPYVNILFDAAVAWLGIALRKQAALPLSRRHRRAARRATL